MGKNNIKLAILFLLLLLGQTIASSPFPGYTLYCPNNSKYTYLLDINNNKVKTWSHTTAGGYSCYLQKDGSLYRTANKTGSLNGGGATGLVQKIAWNGSILWQYQYSSTTVQAHHDIEPLPNGNVLIIAWELKSATEAVAAGSSRGSVAVWPDHIIEVQPVGTSGGNIVWEWHAWDHLVQDYNSSKSNYGVVKDHPELLNFNMGATGTGDWMHLNAVSYNADLDLIAVSSHNLNEVYVIDHSTTTTEAKTHSGGKRGKGGDILYRWGCPSNYGASGTQVFNVVHNAYWIPDGVPGTDHLMAFNNGYTNSQSMVVELTLPMDTAGNFSKTTGLAFGPSTPSWSYTASGFYSQHLGGCQRLPNGNTIMVESTDNGAMREVDATGNIVWTYAPGAEVVRVLRYSTDYLNDGLLSNETSEVNVPKQFSLEQNYPNPFNPTTSIKYTISGAGLVRLKIYNILGKEITTLVNENKSAGTYTANFDASNLPTGMYIYKLSVENNSLTRKMMLVK